MAGAAATRAQPSLTGEVAIRPALQGVVGTLSSEEREAARLAEARAALEVEASTEPFPYPYP